MQWFTDAMLKWNGTLEITDEMSNKGMTVEILNKILQYFVRRACDSG